MSNQLKGLGKNQKRIIEYLKKQQGYADYSWNMVFELDDIGSFKYFIYPSLMRLTRRGLVKHYFKDKGKWYCECGEKCWEETPSFPNLNRRRSIWVLNAEILKEE